MSLSLEPYGLEALAERYSLPAELGRRAVRYYLADRDSGRLALGVPRFAGDEFRRRSMELGLDLDPGSWGELEPEGERHGVTIERLLEHAIVYLLPDLDWGRVALRALEKKD